MRKVTHAVLASVGALAVLASPALAAKSVPVTAVKAAAAPTLDGNGNDAVWQKAPVVQISAIKGANFGGTGKTTGTVQAAYKDGMFYMLMTWKDATQNAQRSPWVKQADGSWAKLKDPADKGGDNNKFYEDKAAVIWDIGGSIFGFSKRGCQIACHAGDPGKPYGNKYTEEEGELGDIWHIKTVRSAPLGYVDDQWLDHTRFDPKTAKGAGRHSDPKTGGGYKNIGLKGGAPEFMNKNGLPANRGGTYWLKAEEAVAFDASKFQVGDEVASIKIQKPTGDRGDVSAGIVWKDGVWTAEIGRKLVTASTKHDVQFKDLGGKYTFGVAFFDNAQVRHAYQEAQLELTFEK